ncbi:hypothetical protein HDV00_002306 [Rhizophlyctis rosea]|nr:hypothetical protein HDV00_002306 [Rhizophlyctis rosea]
MPHRKELDPTVYLIPNSQQNKVQAFIPVWIAQHHATHVAAKSLETARQVAEMERVKQEQEQQAAKQQQKKEAKSATERERAAVSNLLWSQAEDKARAIFRARQKRFMETAATSAEPAQ